MQSFDDELEALERKDMITTDAALAYASNQGNLRLALADLIEQDRESAVARLLSGRKRTMPLKAALRI